jgi:GNAT superfamily N-acetyltransferase
MTEVTLNRHSGPQVLAMLPDIADLYHEIHSEDPGDSDPVFSRPSFVARTDKQALEPGFELITAVAGDGLAGFSFGYPMPAGRWRAECTPPSQEVLDSPKFAVIELDVRKACRGQGLGRKLLDKLLADRAEKYATLAATPGSPAQAMYTRWGWYKIGLFTTPPIMDAMLFPLSRDQMSA